MTRWKNVCRMIRIPFLRRAEWSCRNPRAKKKIRIKTSQVNVQQHREHFSYPFLPQWLPPLEVADPALKCHALQPTRLPRLMLYVSSSAALKIGRRQLLGSTHMGQAFVVGISERSLTGLPFMCCWQAVHQTNKCQSLLRASGGRWGNLFRVRAPTNFLIRSNT